jgi:hypothetical protein
MQQVSSFLQVLNFLPQSIYQIWVSEVYFKFKIPTIVEQSLGVEGYDV